MKVNISFGFLTLAFLVLLVLKLTGVVAWSWWIICIPLYFAALAAIFVAGIFIWAGFMFTSIILDLFKKRLF